MSDKVTAAHGEVLLGFVPLFLRKNYNLKNQLMIQHYVLKFLIHSQKGSGGVTKLFVAMMHGNRVHSS